jgi:hypothetical protein
MNMMRMAEPPSGAEAAASSDNHAAMPMAHP